VLDISEQCGYSLPIQFSLFNSLKPLFAGKPVILAANKIDVVSPDELCEEYKEMINQVEKEGQPVCYISTLKDNGLQLLKERACESLLAKRVETKLKGKRVLSNVSKLHLAAPVPRDQTQRPPHIPESVLNRREKEMMEDDDDDAGMVRTKAYLELKREAEDQMLLDMGILPNFDRVDWKKTYDLADPEWKFDKIPEIMNGHNIADFIDPEIERQLEALELEEEHLIEVANEEDEDSFDELDEEEMELLQAIRDKKKVLKKKHNLESGHNKTTITRADGKTESLSKFREHLHDMGLQDEAIEKADERIRSSSTSRGRSESRGRKRSHSQTGLSASGSQSATRSLSKSRSKSRPQSRSKTPSGINISQVDKARKLVKRDQKKRNKDSRIGEADREIFSKMPKHLFTGKRGIGKNQRR